MNFNWHENGFAYPPTLSTASGKERLFRAWGGDPRRKWGNIDLPGVCFSLDRARSRLDAESLYSVMEYQNPVSYLTEFSIPAGTFFWYGMVDPGDPRAHLGDKFGQQVLIERAYIHLIREVTTKPLKNDLKLFHLYTGKLPNLSS